MELQEVVHRYFIDGTEYQKLFDILLGHADFKRSTPTDGDADGSVSVFYKGAYQGSIHRAEFYGSRIVEARADTNFLELILKELGQS